MKRLHKFSIIEKDYIYVCAMDLNLISNELKRKRKSTPIDSPFFLCCTYYYLNFDFSNSWLFAWEVLWFLFSPKDFLIQRSNDGDKNDRVYFFFLLSNFPLSFFFFVFFLNEWWRRRWRRLRITITVKRLKFTEIHCTSTSSLNKYTSHNEIISTKVQHFDLKPFKDPWLHFQRKFLCFILLSGTFSFCFIPLLYFYTIFTVALTTNGII